MLTSTEATWRVLLQQDRQATTDKCPQMTVVGYFTSTEERIAREVYATKTVPMLGLKRLQFRPAGAREFKTVLSELYGEREGLYGEPR
jgi:hypothetical protein